jgi:chemotaxis signal transduction protein
MPKFAQLFQTAALLADKRFVGPYLTFRVARQEFAMDAARVRGLLPVHEMTPLDSGEVICGIASLRAHDFPVVDLRRRLGLEPGPGGRQPCMIVVELPGPRLVGFIADRISEVVTLRDRDVRNDRVRIGGRTRPLLHPESILTARDFENFAARIIP